MWKAEGRGQEIRMSDAGGDISDGVRLGSQRHGDKN